MKNMAKILAFACVDLYNVHYRIFVGKLTIMPVGGTGRFVPNKWDKKFGDLWKL